MVIRDRRLHFAGTWNKEQVGTFMWQRIDGLGVLCAWAYMKGVRGKSEVNLSPLQTILGRAVLGLTTMEGRLNCYGV